jgi:hypothetical protein
MITVQNVTFEETKPLFWYILIKVLRVLPAVNIDEVLQGWHVARLAAGVGATGLTCHRPQCALLHYSFLPVIRQLAKQVLFKDCLCKQRYIET